jgi:hypothetical protein
MSQVALFIRIEHVYRVRAGNPTEVDQLTNEEGTRHDR